MLDLDSNIWQVHDGTLLALGANDLDIWAFSQIQTESISKKLQAVLTMDELSRAEKYYTSELQNQYIVRRGILRTILSRYLDCFASEIEFCYSEWGKPQLDGNQIHFNLSHSHDSVVVAVSKEPLIGIDIEFTVPIPDMKRVAEHHFSQSEQAILFALDESEQLKAFYQCWTRKEAFIKADGRGLGIALDSFDVTLAPDDTPQLLRIGDKHNVASQWSMRNLPLDNKDYLGAVLTYGAIHHQRYWQVNFESLKQLS